MLAGQRLQHLLLLSGGQRVGRCRPLRCWTVHPGLLGAVVATPCTAEQVTGLLHARVPGELVDGWVDHRCGGFGVPVLSESVSKSACAFPTMSNAALVRASSVSAFSARALSCSISRSRRSLSLDSSAVTAPAWAALRHPVMWEEYRPSRRKIAPRSPWSAASYSATIYALYSAVKVRRLGRSARGLATPSSSPVVSANVMVIRFLDSPPRADRRNSVMVSHLSLTHRALPVARRSRR